MFLVVKWVFSFLTAYLILLLYHLLVNERLSCGSPTKTDWRRPHRKIHRMTTTHEQNEKRRSRTPSHTMDVQSVAGGELSCQNCAMPVWCLSTAESKSVVHSIVTCSAIKLAVRRSYTSDLCFSSVSGRVPRRTAVPNVLARNLPNDKLLFTIQR